MEPSSHDSVCAELVLLRERIDNLVSLVSQLVDQSHGPRLARLSYTVEEAAALLKKRPYTVREWCRLGRIDATKRTERRGGAEL